MPSAAEIYLLALLNLWKDIPPFSVENVETLLAQLIAQSDYLTEDENSLVTIAWEHRQVHVGKLHTIEYSNSVNNNANLDVQIETGLLDLHTAFAVQAGGQVTVYLYEAPTTSGGTSLTPLCMNRNITASLLSTFKHTPSVTGTGTTLINGRLVPGDTTVQTRVGGSARSGAEWLLKPSTKYLVRATNTSGVATIINAVFEVYEEA